MLLTCCETSFVGFVQCGPRSFGRFPPFRSALVLPPDNWLIFIVLAHEYAHESIRRVQDFRTSPGLKYIDQFGTCNVGPIHCAHHSWWNPPLGFCHHDWLQMLLCSYTHTTASLVDIFLFFRSSCLYLDLCSMLVNLISSRSRDNNIWSHVSSRPHGGPDDGVDFSIGIDQKPSVCLCHIMSWNMLMTLKFHDIDQDWTTYFWE